MRAKSRASKCFELSTSPPRPRWPTAWTRRRTRPSSFSTFGGGTFDVSILDVGEGVFEVRSTAGDSHLGGDDYDNKIVEYLASEFKKDQGVDLMKDKAAVQRLREAAERAKIELSNQMSTQVNLPYITAVDNEPKHMDYALTRAKFEELTADLMERVKKPFQQALEDAKLKAGRS